MALNYATAIDAILGTFKVAWDANTPALTGALAPVIVYESSEPDLKPHPKDSTLPWARAVVRHADTSKVTLASDTGTARYRRPGLAWVQIFVPANSAKDWFLAQSLAMAAQAAFEGKRSPGDGVLFTAASIHEVPREAAWFRFDVKVGFYWDQVR